MKKLLTGSMAIGLLFAVASCSSDAKPATTTTAAATADSTADSTATADSSATGDTAAAGAADTSGLDAVHAQAYTMGLDSAAAGGAALDPVCFKAIIAQLSAEDAQLIVDAGPNGQPTLSAAGEALGAQVVSTCVTTATS